MRDEFRTGVKFRTGVRWNLPQFDGHFEKEYTMSLKGVSNEKEAGVFTRV